MPVGPQETVLIPWGSRIVAIGVVAVCAAVEGSLVVFGRAEPLLRATPAVALVAALMLVLFWLPRVSLTPADVEVVNPFRTYRVTWPAVREVGSRWSLTLFTDTGRIEAWAAPAPGPLTQGGSLLRYRSADGSAPRGRAGRVEIGADGQQRTAGAAAVVRRQWEAYRDAGLLGAVEGEGVTRRWHTARIAVLAALTVLTLVGILWH